MNRPRMAAMVVLSGLILVIASNTFRPVSAQVNEPAAVQKWEYFEHFAGNEDHQGPLNKLGSQGWELVTAYSKESQGPTCYVFRRAKK